MAKWWMVRAGRDSIYAEDFIAGNIVAIGWSELGDIPATANKSDILKRYEIALPDHSEGQAQNGVSQVKRFLSEIQVGDSVVTYDRDRRIYYIGVIQSEPFWSTEISEELPRVRNVKWAGQVTRNHLSVESRNTLGAIQTLFSINPKVASELQSKSTPIGHSSPHEEAVKIPPDKQSESSERIVEREIRAELIEKAEESIEDRISRLNWEEVQELVAGILRAMGYRTSVSPRGADRGVDIFASPDGLGLEEPRIFVEVKHRTSTMGAQDIRSFIGGRSSNDRCLYISTGGFTKDARYEADRSSVPLQLLGLVELRKLFVDYYDKLDEATKSLIPLRRVYVLAN